MFASVKPVLLICLLWAGAWARAAELGNYTRFCATCGLWGANTFVSESGQFVVHGRSGTKFPPRLNGADPRLYVELDPQLAAVTAERVKRALATELGGADAFSGKVHIVLQDLAPSDQPIGIVSHVHPDGFQYQMGIPGYVEHSRLIRGLVSALLLDYANNRSTRSAEIPAWVVEGFSRQLISGVAPTYVINKKPVTIETLGYDRLSASRGSLKTNTPLTIEELSFADFGRMSAADRERFETSAHLLVYQLLRLKGGPALMSEFLHSLPRSLNWQTAFLNAYRAEFRSPLDFEKWWMMAWLDVKDRQAGRTLPLAVSLERLRTVLLTPAELRLNTNSIPKRETATLQELIYATDFSVHRQIFGQKLQQIFFLSLNLAPEALALANGYEQTLQAYVQKRSNDYQPGLKSSPEQRLQLLIKNTISSLDELDRAMEELQAGRKTRVPKAVRELPRQARQ